MMLYSIKFDFIELSRRPINEKEEKFYCSTIKALTSDKALSFADNKNNVTIPIPISQLQSAAASYILKDKFNEWIINAGLLNENGDLTKNSFYISLDITKNVSDKLCIQLFYFLSEILMLSKNEGDIKFFIFLDILPSENDVLWYFLKIDVNKELIFLINVKDGEFLPQKDDVRYDKVRFKEKRKLLLPDNKYLLKQKLVRKLGHFKVENEDNFCHSFFYDGSFCEEEIKSLLLEYIESSSDCDQFELIVYAAKYSPWLRQSIEHLFIESQDNPKLEKAIAFENIDKYIENYQGGKLLFITDLIHSGESIKEMLIELSSKMQNFKMDKIHILSILNSEKEVLNTENKRKITINNHDFQITYFVDVKIDAKMTKKNCEMCKLNLSFDKIESESILKLKSYYFWSLSDNAKYEQEKYGRQKDRLMKKITIMNNWFDENSAYIVYKYIKLLKTINIDAKYGSIFIYPKENVTKDNPTPSNRLAESFRIFFNAKEIGIPRELIEKYEKEDAPIDDIDSIQDDWIQAVKEQSRNQNYIIIDEFHKDGGTFKGMINILRKLNRNPKCFFPVINFNPQKNEEYKIKYENLEILSLYEFNLG
jgi:hypothetical protein